MPAPRQVTRALLLATSTSPRKPGESIIPCVRDGGAYVTSSLTGTRRTRCTSNPCSSQRQLKPRSPTDPDRENCLNLWGHFFPLAETVMCGDVEFNWDGATRVSAESADNGVLD